MAAGLGVVRWMVERTLAWLRQFRHLRVRYERRADIHVGCRGVRACIHRLYPHSR